MGDRPLERELLRLRWRVGRKVGRTIYAIVGNEPSDADVLIGLLDSRELASLAAADHNAALGDAP